MSTAPNRPIRGAMLGAVVGLVALVVLTAILTSAVSSSRADKQTSTLVSALADANHQLDMLRDADAASRERSIQASTERDQARNQVSELQRQIHVLVQFLRNHGIKAPVLVERVTVPVPRAHPKTSPAPAPAPVKHGKGHAKHKKK